MAWETGKTYRIWYRTETGDYDERVIDVIQIIYASNGRVYLRAFCHLRNAERTFRSDRVHYAELCTGRTSTIPVESLGITHPALPHTKPMLHTVALPIVPIQSQKSSINYQAIPREKSSKTFGDFLSSLTGYGIAIIVLGVILGNLGLFDMPSSSTASRSSSTYTNILPQKPAVKPTQKPIPTKPSLEEINIGGRILRTYRNNGKEQYEVPSLGLLTANKVEAIEAIRLPAFIATTGLSNSDLISRYLEADLNKSGKLSFDELEAFQRKTYREFSYMANTVALRPDEFLESKGGDCEDFALYTAGLLRFWGWDPYLGSIGPSNPRVGHAVCLSYEEGTFSSRYIYFNLQSWMAVDGSDLKSGKYVPIDYDQVGSLSNAVDEGWKLRSIYIPEKAWGLTM